MEIVLPALISIMEDFLSDYGVILHSCFFIFGKVFSPQYSRPEATLITNKDKIFNARSSEQVDRENRRLLLWMKGQTLSKLLLSH